MSVPARLIPHSTSVSPGFEISFRSIFCLSSSTVLLEVRCLDLRVQLTNDDIRDTGFMSYKASTTNNHNFPFADGTAAYTRVVLPTSSHSPAYNNPNGTGGDTG